MWLRLIDEAALIEALKAKRIMGVGLDVFAQDRLAPKNPLLQPDNVVITPDCGGSPYNTWLRRLDFAGADIGRAGHGESPTHLIP